MSRPHIVVGVDGAACSWAALRWAAQQADATARDLLVAYASEASDHLGRYGVGDELARTTVAAMTSEFPALVVHTAVVDSDPVETLLELATEADLLVLGRGRHGGSLLEIASVLNRVLTRVHRPTVVVGDAGGPAPERGTTGRRAGVVLGVSASVGGAAALRFACTEADRSGSRVVALRSSADPQWKTQCASSMPPSPSMWDNHEQDLLDECVQDARTLFPALAIDGSLVAEALEAAFEGQAGSCALLVLGCRRADDAEAPRLGATTSWAVHHLSCPVAVIGHAA